jgi:hypothetical protein
MGHQLCMQFLFSLIHAVLLRCAACSSRTIAPC